MRLSNVVRLYRVRLRSRLVQEAFALSGIAVGVALLFASQVASTSLNGSIQQITEGIVGNMRFQLAARAPEGFDQRLLGQVKALPGVNAALPVLEIRVNMVGPAGARAVDLLGAEPQLAEQAGPLVRQFSYARLASLQALGVPAPVAQAVGVASLGKVTLQVGSLAPTAFVGATLTAQNIGALADSPIALGPLRYVQRLTRMAGRVTSIFVSPRPGDEREVRAGLASLAATDALNLRPADFEAKLFSQAAGPTNQSTLLFSAISALVGFLFAFNAILLTVPQRRNLVEDLRLDGYSAGMIVRILLFDALVLGVLASLAGLALGELLSVELFSANPGYLSLGFPVGSQRIVTWQSVAIALGGGTLAAVVGVLAPLRREMYAPLSSALVPSERSGGSVLGALVVGVACLAGTTAILLADPQAAIVGIVCLIAALLLLLPVALTGVVAVLARLRRFFSGVSPYLAVIELRSRANRARALAIGATGAIAVFGSVAIQGAHSNLQQGLDRLVHQLNTNAQLWVVPPGEGNLLATAPFPGARRLGAEEHAGRQRGRTSAGWAAGLRRPPGVGARRSARCNRADSSEPAPQRRARDGRGEDPGGRMGRRLAGPGPGTPSPHRAVVRTALAATGEVARGGPDHEPRLAARRDHPELGRLRSRVGQRRSERVLRQAGPRGLGNAGAGPAQAGAGFEPRTGGRNVSPARTSPACGQPPGPGAADPDLVARADRRRPGDGRRHGLDGLAAAQAAGGSEGRRLQAG